MKGVCCIFNLAPHYRAPIYRLMDKELSCDFYFGNDVGTPIKLMDVESLNGYKSTVNNRKIRFITVFLWQDGVWKLIFKPYKHYIITGSPGCLSNWVILIFAHILGKKVYAWTHGMRGNNSGKRKFLEKSFYRLCHRLLLYGEFSKKNMIKEGFNEKKLVLIYNSLDHEKQMIVRQNLYEKSIYKDHFGNDRPILVYIGRIQKIKRIDTLIEALALLKKEKQECNLVIIGPDVEGNGLANLAQELGLLKNIWFYGPSYEEEEIGNLLYNADVCVSPGSVGLTALHCMTYGLPVITHDNFNIQMPEFEVIKEGITGAFYKEGSIEDVFKKIKMWINLNSKDRNKVRKKAYEIVDSKYNPKYQIEAIKRVISELD